MIFQETLRGYPSFRLHEVTQQDILGLIHHSLASVELYAQIWEHGYTRDWFEQEIAGKSDGVFLWVSLILKVLEDGLFSGDRLRQLEEKIDSLPTKLEDLFSHLFVFINPIERKLTLC
jgi:hypothetical protein